MKKSKQGISFFSCYICSEITPIVWRNQHHIIPQSAGGKDFDEEGKSNIVDLCTGCHDEMHSLAVVMRGKKAGQVNDILSKKTGEEKKKIIYLAQECNKFHFLKKDGFLDLSKHKETIVLKLSLPLKNALKTLASETKNPTTNKKLGVSTYLENLITSHIVQKFPKLKTRNSQL